MLAAGFDTRPEWLPAYNWVNGLRDGVLLVSERDGQLVGTAGAVCFGPTGWLGGITVVPEQRGTGLGAALTEAACEWLTARGTTTVLLLATEPGRRVYERLGFEEEGEYLTFQAATGSRHRRLRPLGIDDAALVAALDRVASGERRDPPIDAAFPSGWAFEDRGVALVLPWAPGHAIAADEEAGEALISIGRSGSNWSVPVANHAAVAAIRRRGWTEREWPTVRMRRGSAIEWRPDMVWGAFNLFWG